MRECYRLNEFKCEECFNESYVEEVGSGEDLEGGEFTAYECEECGHITRVY